MATTAPAPVSAPAPTPAPLSTPQKTAILSVYSKVGLLDLAKGLIKCNVRLLGSGGTAKMVREAGMHIEDISAITKSPEMLGGRVKSLHPAIHGGILARAGSRDDEKDLAENSIRSIDFVVCNLYPFQDTIAKPGGVKMEEAVEEIDIGGVTLLRAAAKNHSRVTVLCDPSDYPAFLAELTGGEISPAKRNAYALKAFEHTADYDTAIADYFRRSYAGPLSANEGNICHLPLRYGLNPHQKPATASMASRSLPFKVLSGSPGYINLLDALSSWSLVKELSTALDLPAAASFKHVSPAGAAVALPLSPLEKEIYFVADLEGIDSSPQAQAYARARGADRMSSFGDWIALSGECDIVTAKLIAKEVSDGVIAARYSPEALAILKGKKGGKYTVLEMDPNYEPPNQERRDLYGVSLSQGRNDVRFSPAKSFSDIKVPRSSPPSQAPSSSDPPPPNRTQPSPSLRPIPPAALRDLTIAAISLKYTQSNSVALASRGQLIGLGAGQQSRIHCTRLAASKADVWWMRHHPRARPGIPGQRLDGALRWAKGTKRPDKSNAIDVLCSGEIDHSYAALAAGGADSGAASDVAQYEGLFEQGQAPRPFTEVERREWTAKMGRKGDGVGVGVGSEGEEDAEIVLVSDAFFPFADNVYRCARSGVRYVAAASGSVRDEDVWQAAEKLGITYIDLGIRLFLH